MKKRKNSHCHYPLRNDYIGNQSSNSKIMFGFQKIIRKEKKMIRKIILSCLVVSWKILKKRKIEYN